MRKISLFLSAALLFVATSYAAGPADGPTKNLSEQIHAMLDGNTLEVRDDLTADVRFTVNQEGEIVVLSIETKSEALEGFVKGRLNYQKVELSQVKEGKIYTVPVRITA
ncbi:hypothetical protein [Croceivirga thetidis]|uniref:Auto-transporter adhesin head GIN domain-containing protein n=1 Tax=Croceivirga thetidis TaxID=2721623 RepID=A0ABX1GSJ9_9FLAO|nr:hypothetical protein [Croceivirga thetidis]NKI32934.1 hypothetical protein [Croceivirga thetidis]